MLSCFQLLFWGCVICFDAFIRSEYADTKYFLATQNCTKKIGVVYTSDNWGKQLGGQKRIRDIGQGKVSVGVMEKIKISAEGHGINFTDEKSSYVFACCDSTHSNISHLNGITEWKGFNKFFGISNGNCLLLLLNLVLFMSTMIGALVLKIKYSKALARAEPVESQETA